MRAYVWTKNQISAAAPDVGYIFITHFVCGRDRFKSKSFVYSELIKLVWLESRRFPARTQSTLWSAEARKAHSASLDAAETLSIQWERPNSFASQMHTSCGCFPIVLCRQSMSGQNLTPFKLRRGFALELRKMPMSSSCVNGPHYTIFFSFSCCEKIIVI